MISGSKALSLARLSAWGVIALASAACGSSLAPHLPLAPSALRTLRQELKDVAGTLEVLTYNVAGLPALVSPSNPDINTRQASPHFNRYDVVLAQEDFTYHSDLVGAVTHPFQLAPRDSGTALVGDGLTTLSNYPLAAEERHTWRSCSGYLFSLNDCLGEKGFSVAHVWLTEVEPVFVYNLHADAGADAADVEARTQAFTQLADHIEAHAKLGALIVGGDTNLIKTTHVTKPSCATSCSAPGCRTAVRRSAANAAN